MDQMDKVKITIIGAGVVGLAIAAELSKKQKDVLLLEAEDSFGQHTSSRNSEVIHAGIYYPPNSLKAKLCLEGNQLLYAFCQENLIPYAKTGKLIVAMDEGEAAQLRELQKKAKANGVLELQWVEKCDIKRFEPAISAYAALFSHSTGIIDSHSLMKTLEQQAKDRGVMLSYASEVTGIEKIAGGYVIEINHGEHKFASGVVVNSAGLFSDRIAAMLGIDIKKEGYDLHYCKGEYFSFSKPSFLKHLVYPVPEQDIKGLGIHAVLDLAGGMKFGPNAEYVDQLDYKVDSSHRKLFYEAIKELFPQINEADLAPDQAGIRPKLQGQGEGFRDFVIMEESKKGLPGLINLIGIESPGLTASLSIAKYLAALLD